MAEVTYYWNVYYLLWCWANESLAFDGNLATFANTSTDGCQIEGRETNCLGTDLGTITKVGIRCYGYGDGDDRIDIAFISDMSTEYQLTMPSSEDWSAYADVTGDPNVNGWTWAKVQQLYIETGLRLWAEFDKSGKGNTMYCAKVEIRVTYTPSVGYYHGVKVQGEGELALCDVGSHPLRIRKGGTTYGVELVETDDPNASKIRIKTGAGIKAIRKYS